MRLASAFPRILDRQYPVVRPDYPLITVLYLLGTQEGGAVALSSERTDESRAVFAYACFERLLKLGPRRFASFLQGPCENASKQLECLTTNQGLASLLDSFGSQGLGFSLVRGSGSRRKNSLATLADVLRLYESGLIKSRLRVEDVATPMFSMRARTPLREALQAMFDHHYRRVFLEDGRYVSDRSLVEYILYPPALAGLTTKTRKDRLAVPIGKLWNISPIPVARGANLKVASMKLREHRGGCLITSGDKVVSQWDLVMKPWLSGDLEITR